MYHTFRLTRREKPQPRSQLRPPNPNPVAQKSSHNTESSALIALFETSANDNTVASTSEISDMSIAWSCVARDGIVIAEAGSDDGNGKVIRTAKSISSKQPTCGWEVALSLQHAPYRGIKFHVHEATGDNNTILIWSFCCVYNSKDTRQECAKAFLSKLVTITAPLRCMPWWREGAALSAQASFAPSLLQLMESAERDYKVSCLKQRVEETRAIMQRNIEAVLDRGEKMEDLEVQAEELKQKTSVFKKKCRQLKKFQMQQHAKHGYMMGTAITVVGGLIIVPPLIAMI